MSGQPGVKIEGVREVVTALRKVDREVPKRVRKEFRAIANFMRDRVRAKLPGKVRGAVTSKATTDYAALMRPRGGPGDRASKYGMYPWLEFGGGRVTGRGVTSGGSRRPFMPEGRWLYPTISEHYDLVRESALKLLHDEIADAGFREG